MNDATFKPVFTPPQSDLFHQNEADLLREQMAAMQATIAQQAQQILALKRELFGVKSERRELLSPEQQAIADMPGPAVPLTDDTPEPPKPEQPNNRGKAPKQRSGNEVNLTGLRYDSTVPVREVIIEANELQGDEADQYEHVGYKEVSRIAQKRSAYEIVITKRQIVKRKDSNQLITAANPEFVFDSACADVSFVAGLLVDKFQFHLPLYRQHQKLTASGIQLSRATLTNITKRGIELLRPVAAAQLANILNSQVLAMDETPIKATRQPGVGKQPGKMKQAYFWPIYGEQDEVAFTYSNSRGMAHIQALLDEVWQGTLLTDGYQAYSSYEAKSEQVENAQCWVHMRRQLLKAEAEECQAVDKALNLIAELYQHEKQIKARQLVSEKALQYRATHSKPIVDQFFALLDAEKQRPDLLPDDTWSKALNYALKRERQLRVFLSNPAVAMDTNHLERQIRPIPMGKKNWLCVSRRRRYDVEPLAA
ncbi:IS66 family transposase [Salinibius halmophilus]|uniref:IS66 family transposase n=1 Tax=Salinibius halmophilus TaxID=1853216 RepID=UPI000E670DDB|nr:IS66 family transposase [Salinibius halmophilus]